MIGHTVSKLPATGLLAAALLLSGAPNNASAQATDPLSGFIGNLFGSKPAERPAQESRDQPRDQSQQQPLKPPQNVGTVNAAQPVVISPAEKAGAAEKAPAQKRPGRGLTGTEPAARAGAGNALDGTPGERPRQETAAVSERGLHPLPPRRPAGRDTSSAAVTAAAAVRGAAEEPVGAIPLSQSAAVQRLNAFLNGFEQITATFVQLNPDGQRVGGSLLVQRPGRLRFKYDPPSTLEVVADGRSVAVREARFPAQVYSMSETPLKFLLKERVDLAADARITGVRIDSDGVVTVSLEDSSTLGGTSKLTLVYDAKANLLRRWDVVDPQGYRTSVALSNLAVIRRPGN